MVEKWQKKKWEKSEKIENEKKIHLFLIKKEKDAGWGMMMIQQRRAGVSEIGLT